LRSRSEVLESKARRKVSNSEKLMTEITAGARKLCEHTCGAKGTLLMFSLGFWRATVSLKGEADLIDP
jgi:hypothetical protein